MNDVLSISVLVICVLLLIANFKNIKNTHQNNG